MAINSYLDLQNDLINVAAMGFNSFNFNSYLPIADFPLADSNRIKTRNFEIGHRRRLPIFSRPIVNSNRSKPPASGSPPANN
jgi:hypothetical protein